MFIYTFNNQKYINYSSLVNIIINNITTCRDNYTKKKKKTAEWFNYGGICDAGIFRIQGDE